MLSLKPTDTYNITLPRVPIGKFHGNQGSMKTVWLREQISIIEYIFNNSRAVIQEYQECFGSGHQTWTRHYAFKHCDQGS